MPDRCHEDHEIVHASSEDGADQDPQESGSKTKLSGKCRPDERTGSGNRSKVMPEQHKLRRRNIIVPIFKSVRGSRPTVVQRQNFSCKERAVVAIGNRINAKRAEDRGERIHTRLPPSGNSISGKTCSSHPWVFRSCFFPSHSSSHDNSHKQFGFLKTVQLENGPRPVHGAAFATS